MRNFSSGFQAKLASDSYLPVLFCKYYLVTYVSNPYMVGQGSQTTTEYFWAEREITYGVDTYEPRIVNTAPLEQVLEADNQAFSSMGLQISNAISNISGVIQSGMKCEVYLGFEDSVGSGVVFDAELLFTGTVEGDIEITEDSISFSMQDIAHTYDSQVPALISRVDFPEADPDALGDTKPVIMGRVAESICKPVAAGFGAITAQDFYGYNTAIYVTEDIGWWANQDVMAHFQGELVVSNIRNYSDDQLYTKRYTIESIEFDVTENLWKLNIDTANSDDWENDSDQFLKANSPIYIEDYNGMAQEGYVYLVADHPVESITNVKIDGLTANYWPVLDHVNGQSLIQSILPEHKAYIIVQKSAGTSGLSGGSGLQIIDNIDVDDSIDVDDTIDVNETGHDHASSSSAQVYDFTIDIQWSYLGLGSQASYIDIAYGFPASATSDRQIIRVFQAISGEDPIYIQGPISLTTDSPSIEIRYQAAGASSLTGSGNFKFINIAVNRVDSLGGTANHFESITSVVNNRGEANINFPNVIGGESTSINLANVSKTGSAAKSGAAIKTGTIELGSGNSAADILVGSVVTCDVIGICDGSTGYVPPHQMIKKFINTYAKNKVNQNDIVEFVNEAEADAYFDTVYNAATSSESAATDYPRINTYDLNDIGGYNPSPNTTINYAQEYRRGFHALDFAISEPNRFRDVLGDMLYQAHCSVTWENGIAKVRFIPDEPTEDSLVDSSDIVMKSSSLARSRASDLATDISVRYDYNFKKGYTDRYEYAYFDMDPNTGRFDVKVPLDATRTVGTYSRERVYDLTMIRDDVAAEIISKRLYDSYAHPKFTSSFSSTLKNLAIQAGDFVTVKTPIYENGVLDRGVVKRNVVEFGSAIDKRPDLLHMTIDESHIANGFYLTAGAQYDSVTVNDDDVSITLNDAHTLFLTLSDSLTVAEVFNLDPTRSFSDSVSISESMAFEYELSLSETVTVNDDYMKFTGLLFWDVGLTDSVTVGESVLVEVRESVFELDVFETGVFE